MERKGPSRSPPALSFHGVLKLRENEMIATTTQFYPVSEGNTHSGRGRPYRSTNLVYNLFSMQVLCCDKW